MVIPTDIDQFSMHRIVNLISTDTLGTRISNKNVFTYRSKPHAKLFIPVEIFNLKVVGIKIFNLIIETKLSNFYNLKNLELLLITGSHINDFPGLESFKNLQYYYVNVNFKSYINIDFITLLYKIRYY